MLIKYPIKGRHLLLLLVTIVLAAISLGVVPLLLDKLWNLGLLFSTHPFASVLLVLVMAVTMSLGLPGSVCFWLIAPFYPLVAAIPMLLLGSVSGALGAYQLSARLSDGWRARPMASRIVRLLERRSDILTQCALRILPGFPHALINFGSGILALPLFGFVLAAVLGLTVKWSVYALAVHGAVNAAQAERALGWEDLAPLVIVAALLLVGGAARYMLEKPGRAP